MIHVEIDDAEGRISGVVSLDGGAAEAFAGWLQLVAAIEAARGSAAAGLGSSFPGEWTAADEDQGSRT